jgi:hypothetical protein
MMGLDFNEWTTGKEEFEKGKREKIAHLKSAMLSAFEISTSSHA